MSSPNKNIESLRAMKDEEIDFSEIPELDSTFWKKAKLVKAPKKKAISLRIDEETLSYFKAQGKGYQSLINDVLRTYAHAHRL